MFGIQMASIQIPNIPVFLFQLAVEDDTMADEEEEEDDGKGPPKLFTMNFVNSYGNAHLEQLNNDDKPLKLTSKSEH